MNGSDLELLQWARGPGFVIAISVFLFGVVLRLFEVLALGRKPDLSEARQQKNGSGWHTIFSRSFVFPALSTRTAVTYISGYVFHLGLFIIILLYIPHIELIREMFGIGWPGLSTPVVDAVAVITMIALLIMLIDRVTNPVKRLLSTASDYIAWVITFLPVITGYMAYHHILFPYTKMLALHILSVELLLVLLPFTKLIHVVTLFLSRWYNGELFARKGVAS